MIPPARPAPALAACRLLAAMLAATACSEADDGSRCGPTEAVVSRVVDGDTIELTDGTRVRYLMVDTPELSACYGEEARTYNEELVHGRSVTLGYDVECRDAFGRLLAYVWVQDREVGALLVERGYACVLYIPPNGKGDRQRYEQLEAQAKAAGKGMWGKGACTEVPCGS